MTMEDRPVIGLTEHQLFMVVVIAVFYMVLVALLWPARKRVRK